MNEQLHNLQEVKDLAKLQAQMQKPAQNVNVDGSFELGWGTAVICFGMGPYLTALLPKAVWASVWTSWIGFLPLMCAAFAPYGIPKVIKRYLTWPRIGYVANPFDVKLKQLVMLMVFGGTLGYSLVLPFILFFEIRHSISHPGATGELQSIILHAVKLVVCAGLVVWLYPKVITKRGPLPSAYDATFIREIQQTDMGRKVVRGVKLTLLVLFVGVPMVVCGVVFGVIYLSKSALSYGEVDWPHLAALSLLVGPSAILYLMGNAVSIRQHRWKWLLFVFMLTGPVGAIHFIPYPAVPVFSQPVVEMFPPQAMLCLGLTWFVSGLATLVLFMRHHPLPTSEPA